MALARNPVLSPRAKICYAIGRCSLGTVLVAQSERGLCALFLGDDPQALERALHERFPQTDLAACGSDFAHILAEVVAFIEAPGTQFDLPLDPHGTVFQQLVWQALREIPRGQTATYGEIARRIGAPRSARAVGQACADNPLAVIIPCHRAVHSDGGLAGYRWGIERKRALQEMEK